MTSINAIRFDDCSGAMICDEQRHWNDERMKIFGADKIRPVIPEEIISRYGLVAAYGNTGTSSIGDELRFKIKQRVHDIYKKRVEIEGSAPQKFLSMEELAEVTFQVITEVKHDHVNEHLKNSFSFTTDDFIQGEYTKNGVNYKIKTKEVIDKALKEISGTSENDMGGAVFGNAGILSGYSPEDGFQIYLFSMRHCFYEPVPAGFVAQGSGSDTANVSFSKFFSQLSRTERMNSIDKMDGIITAIHSVNQAHINNLGVGGYFNIYLFDGKKPNMEKVIEINDDRAKFCMEIIHASSYGLIPREKVKEAVKGLLFEDKNVDWASKLIWDNTKNKVALHRFLRGYPARAWEHVTC